MRAHYKYQDYCHLQDLSDGAAVLCLEKLEDARARGANILAEVVGFGMSGDAFHMTQPDETGSGAANAMRAALEDAGIAPTAIDCINAHGTSTPLNDITEVKAVKQVFDAHAYQVPMSSVKSMLGHSLGAAGAIEAVVAGLTLRDQRIPPTINCHQPSEGCDLDFVPHASREAKIDHVLSNSFGFGGTNASLIFKRYDDVDTSAA